MTIPNNSYPDQNEIPSNTETGESPEILYLPFVIRGHQGPENLWVVSYNTHDGSDVDWAGPLNQFIAQVSSNEGEAIVGLQESTPAEIRTRMQEYGWDCIVSDGEQHLCDTRPGFGFNIVPETVQIHQMPACRGKDRFAISARVVNPDGDGFYITTSHICHVDQVRQTALSRIEEIVRILGGEAVVTADFNTTPEELSQSEAYVDLACGSSVDLDCQSVGSRGHVDNVAVIFTNPNTGEQVQLSIENGQRGIVTDASDHTPVAGEIGGIRSVGTNRQRTMEFTGVPDNNYPNMPIFNP